MALTEKVDVELRWDRLWHPQCVGTPNIRHSCKSPTRATGKARYDGVSDGLVRGRGGGGGLIDVKKTAVLVNLSRIGSFSSWSKIQCSGSSIDTGLDQNSAAATKSTTRCKLREGGGSRRKKIRSASCAAERSNQLQRALWSWVGTLSTKVDEKEEAAETQRLDF